MKITWTKINQDTESVARLVDPLCEYDTDGLEDWLSHASTSTNTTAHKLAAEWDSLHQPAASK